VRAQAAALGAPATQLLRNASARAHAESGTVWLLAQDDDSAPVAVLEIEDSIDLHGFQPRDVLNVVEDYLEAAADKGYTEVRLIHGRGKGVQRARIQALLGQHPAVESFRDAPATRGGWGATVVSLARKPQP
jgi:dsDNA-specific endonuclease/ATPase MutS2